MSGEFTAGGSGLFPPKSDHPYCFFTQPESTREKKARVPGLYSSASKRDLSTRGQFLSGMK